MKVNLLSLGDCTDLNTWSSLPYYFYHGLLDHNVAVQPIDLIPSGILYAILSQLTAVRGQALQRFGRASTDNLRSRTHHALINRHNRAMIQQYADVDLNLFLTFTFSSYQYTSTPVVHFCDRTYQLFLEESGQTPTPNDRAFIEIERQNIEHAGLVLTTGQLCADFIASQYNARHVVCLRGGNNTDSAVPNPDRLIAEKENSTDILFIGRGAHKRGVDVLIRAFKMFNQRHGERFVLHIVGVRPNELCEEFGSADERIRFHGYLDRTRSEDLQRYNALLRSARMFVMPMRPGPFPGVIKEVQLFCTPVIVSAVSGNSETLTNEHDSVIVSSLEPQAFADQMDRLVQDPVRWRKLALNAHAARRNYTWRDTAQNFLQVVRDCGLLKKGR